MHVTTTTFKIHNCSITTKNSLTLPHSPPCPLILSSGDRSSAFYLCSSGILRMLGKWNHIIHKFWDLIFVTRRNALRVHPGCRVWLVPHSLSPASSNPLHADRRQSRGVQPAAHWRTCGLLLFCYYKESCYKHPGTGFSVTISFNFSGINVYKCNRWVPW